MHNNKEALKKQEEIRERQQKLAAKQRKQNLTTRPKRYPPIRYGKIAANNPPVPMMERK